MSNFQTPPSGTGLASSIAKAIAADDDSVRHKVIDLLKAAPPEVKDKVEPFLLQCTEPQLAEFILAVFNEFSTHIAKEKFNLRRRGWIEAHNRSWEGENHPQRELSEEELWEECAEDTRLEAGHYDYLVAEEAAWTVAQRAPLAQTNIQHRSPHTTKSLPATPNKCSDANQAVAEWRSES